MKKIGLIALASPLTLSISAQNKRKWVVLLPQTGDHFMIQLTSDHWIGTPDSIKSHMKGLAMRPEYLPDARPTF